MSRLFSLDKYPPSAESTIARAAGDVPQMTTGRKRSAQSRPCTVSSAQRPTEADGTQPLPSLAARLQAPIDRRGFSQRCSRTQALLRGNLQEKPKAVGRQQQGGEGRSSSETSYSSKPAGQTPHTQACCSRFSRPCQHAQLSRESRKTGKNKDTAEEAKQMRTRL